MFRRYEKLNYIVIKTVLDVKFNQKLLFLLKTALLRNTCLNTPPPPHNTP